MDWVKVLSLGVFSAIAILMVLTVFCQMQALRYVAPGRQWEYKKAIRKWQFAYARKLVSADGQPWLTRVEKLLRIGIVLLAVAALAAVSIMVFGPQSLPG